MVWGNPLKCNFFVFIRITRKKLEKLYAKTDIFGGDCNLIYQGKILFKSKYITTQV